jgi:hypothetical protein
MRHAVRHNTSSLLALKGAYRIVKDQKTQHPANPIGISFAVHPATICLQFATWRVEKTLPEVGQTII